MKPNPADLVSGILIDLLDHGDVDELFDYLKHVGFDLASIRKPSDLPAAWLGHYRNRVGTYDVDRALTNLVTWPPIADRIAELKAEGEVFPNDL